MTRRQFEGLKGHGTGMHDHAEYKPDEQIEAMSKRIQEKYRKIEEEEGIKLSSKTGCLWCYRPRMEGSLYCCKEHQHLDEFYNWRFLKKKEDSEK